MSIKLLDTFVRISTGTRAKLNSYCKKNNLQQGRFADTAILAAIAQHMPAPKAVQKPGRVSLAQFHKAPKRASAE